MPLKRHRIPYVATVVVALLTGHFVSATLTGASAAGSYCGLTGMTPNRFIGTASTAWTNPANWSLGLVPDESGAAAGYVCIEPNKTAVLSAGEAANVQAFDVATSATLRLNEGSKLFVFGNKSTRPTTVRSGSVLRMTRSALGGPGRIDIAGRMHWTSAVGNGATLSTRRCSFDASVCAAPGRPTSPGLLVVGDTGTMRVDGSGVNLFDDYRVVVRGTAILTNQGYVAADRGTTFELRPRTPSGTGVGRLVISNNGGYYEGRNPFSLPKLSTFVNAGMIVRDTASGTAVVSASYSTAGSGRVRVATGALALPDGVTRSASVAGGKAYGSGRCLDYDSYGCRPGTEAGVDVQNGTFHVPAADRSGASVQVYERRSGLAGAVARDVRAHATGLRTSRAAPARIELRYDSSLLGGRGWRQVSVFRRAGGSSTYRRLPRCLSDGRPPVGVVACVDRRGRSTSSRNVLDPGDAAGARVDVIMVVRTLRTSRWVAR